MKKFLVAVTAVAALSLLLAPSTGIAEPTNPNEVGLYDSPDAWTGISGTDIIGSPVDVFVVLSKVEDTETGTPYPTINAFELKLNFDPIGGLFKLGDAYPPQAINVGDNNNIGEGYLEYVVGLGEDCPVVDEQAVLIGITFMHTSSDEIAVTVCPTDFPGIDGHMAFQSVEGDLRVMHSMSGSHEDPVFIFSGIAIAVENESFGSVKALFR
jgi:hypothetical protein